MAKKDLNKNRNTQKNHVKKHNTYHKNNQRQTHTNEINEEENQVNTGSSTQRSYSTDKEAKVTIKLPLKVKLILILVVVCVMFAALLILTVLFYVVSESSGSNGIYAMGQTCMQVSVYDTENNKYDNNEISFDEYIAGVVAAESNGRTEKEYLYLLAVTARTYFFKNATSSCEVKGNSEFQNYIDINDSSNKNQIEQAVKETKDLIITKNEELIDSKYCEGCIINLDNNYYYLRYNSTNIQKIPQNWVSENNLNNKFETLYSSVDKSDNNYQNRECPSNNDDTTLSKYGALYLITNENYNYENVIKYYYGEDIQIIINEFLFESNGEFINPVSTINCTSLYGKRIHPVTNAESFHSGIDLAIEGGSPVYATKSGTITMVEKNITTINGNPQDLPGNASYGNYVIIDHGDGTSTLYAHMKYGSIPNSIDIGNSIDQGEQIGEVGSTGVSTGNHLHYEVRSQGSTVDPMDYLELGEASGYCAK